MNMNRILQNLCTLAASLLMLAACTQDKLSDPSQGEPLPEGKYPMTFSTAVDGLTMTRAATADGLWSADDKIAVQVGSSVKQYTPTNISGNIATLSSTSPFYWQSTADISVSAWYYGTGYSDIPPDGTSWAVQSDQSGDGYQKSDFLYTPARSIAFKPAAGTDNGLTFFHQTAKVVINIVNKEAATNADAITNVVIGNNNNIALSGTYAALGTGQTAGTWSNHANMGTITPKSITAASDYLKSYAALVIPQDMDGKPFIAITLTTGDVCLYTPQDGEAELKSGKQHTYNITVKGTELVVTTETSPSWGTNTDIGSGTTPTEATFHVTLSGSSLPVLSDLTGITLQSGSIYETSDNTFSFSISKDGRKGFLIQKGLAGVSRQESSDKITYTFTNVRSDLVLGYYDNLPQVGDYYYADGTWSANYKPGTPACIGIVFKVDAGTGDNADNYDGKLPDGFIRGYVIALNDANPNAGAWGRRETDESGLTNEGQYINKYDGYKNTCVIRNQGNVYNNTNINNPTANGQYWAFKVASEYSVAAPAGSSGWYLPSIGQLNDIYTMTNRAALLQAAGGEDFRTTPNNGRYWSSTEKNHYDAWYYQFNGSGAQAYAKSNDGGLYLSSSYVRAILTF